MKVIETAPTELPFLDIASWHGQPVPERPWVVRDRIPANNVTLLSGEGSVGKTILSLQLAVATVLGRDWVGLLPELGAVLVIACEDDADELHRRLDLIFQHYGAACTDYTDLHVISLAGQDALMATPTRDGTLKATPLFDRVHEATRDIRPKLIVLDNSADLYGGSENDRAQVRQFIGLLRGLAMAADAGVLLTAHPSLTGMNSGSGLSGSTAWHASVRSRLYMTRATTDKDEEPDPDLRLLKIMKANYSTIGEPITLRWNNGLFLPVAGATHLDRIAHDAKADQLFISLLGKLDQRGENLSPKRTANMYAPTVLAKEPEAKSANIRKADFEAALKRLLDAGKIHLAVYGSPSRETKKLLPGSDPAQYKTTE